MTTTAIILAAGKGTRLRPLTYFVAKPLIKFMGQSLIEHVMNMLKMNDIYLYFVNIHNKPMQMIKNIDDRAVYFYEKELLGSAGTVKALTQYMTEDFVVCNADTISNVDIDSMIGMHKFKKNMATVIWDREKRKGAGVTVLNKRIFPYLVNKRELQDVLDEVGFSKFEQDDLWWFDLGTFHGIFDAYKFFKNVQ